ncbi:nucleotide exchange factor GrpE [Patescibacteria group bacterium]|nr:nucleotide exchange factor GrpE [Patescibacteria group bacterium]
MEKEKKRKAQKELSLDKNLKQLQEERDKYLAGWQRSQADFLNYKKEEGERFHKVFDYRKEQWILELLDILNLFDQAEKGIRQKEGSSSVLEGFRQIKKYFADFLTKHGVEEIISEPGRKFNPHFEEVVETVEGEEEGIIAEVVRKGYQIRGKVIRPAKVKVTKIINKNSNNN